MLIVMLDKNSKNNNAKDKIIVATSILIKAIPTINTYSNAVYSSSASCGKASEKPTNMKNKYVDIKIIKIKIKLTTSADFTQLKSYLSAILFLKLTPIFKATKEIKTIGINNFIKSKTPKIISSNIFN